MSLTLSNSTRRKVEFSSSSWITLQMDVLQDLVRRKVRDIFGNWVWEDEDDERSEAPNPKAEEEKDDENFNSRKDDKELRVKGNQTSQLSLEWRDYVALIIASLQTILLPIVIFIAIIVALVFIFAFFK